MSKLKQLQRAAVGVAAIAVLGTLASTALAVDTGPYQNPFDQSANDPNTTNVPYLAWRGENLRMVKCFGTDDFNRIRHEEGVPSNAVDLTDADLGTVFGSIVQTNVQLEDWSGEDTGVNTPKEVINGARTFLYYNVRTLRPVICFQDTWASQKAGLGQFKLTVSFGLTNIDNTGISLGAQVLVMQHQWLAGWMDLNAPTLDEVSSINPTGTVGSDGKTTGANPEGLGDAKGDGNFIAGDDWYQTSDGTWKYDTGNQHPGEIRATVKGTLPLLQDYSELGLGSSVTLPDDWAKLANALATDADPTDANPAMRWDIHDEMVDEHGNTLTGTGGRDNNATDKVVNVGTWHTPWPTTNNGDASFTRVLAGWWGQPTPWAVPSDSPTAGPFDPNFAEETLLPDGQLNAGDAPMPAARIDFAIAPSTGTTTDGVGSFVSVSKAHDYSMDYTGSNAKTGNLFAPFYSQYIPATSRDPFGYASGVDGAIITNNFPGFLAFGKVQDWTAFPLAYTWPAKTKCVSAYGNLRSGPSGAQTVAVYTDEHGEARVGYLPGGADGNGFNFDVLDTTPHDSNTGCDLGGVSVLGTSHISAIARYPYQKVTDPDKPAKTTLVKTVYSLFQKNLSYYSKNYNPNSPADQLDKLIVAHGQDINGKPFAGETVCFSASFDDAGGAPQLFFPAAGNVSINKADGTQFTVYNSGPVTSGQYTAAQGYICTKLDYNGNAVVEVQTSHKSNIDVLANFVDENLPRDIDITYGATTSQDNPPLTPAMVLGGSTSSTTGAGSNSNTNGNGTPTATQINTIVNAAITAGIGVTNTPAATPAATATITPAQAILKTPAKITAKTIKTRVLAMSLVHPAHSKAYVSVKVQSGSKTAKIVIALKNGKGKTIGSISKTIAANKTVKITSSLLSYSVKKIGLTSVK